MTAGTAAFFLVSAVVGGVALCGVLAIGLGVLRSAPPRLRYAVLVAAFALSLAIPALRLVQGAPSDDRARAGDASHPPAPAEVASVGAVWTPLRQRIAEPGSAAAWVKRLPAFAAAPGRAEWIVALWMVVALPLLLREAAGHLRLRAARRGWTPATGDFRAAAGLPTGVALYVAPAHGPLAVGIVHRAILVPSWLPPAALPAVARHELDHLRWHDPLVNAVLRATCALLWPCPHLWVIERLARLEREVAADR
ncbi:MAG TPA: M56 family metallopeptidase, partial [Longimicrobium sp.]